MLKRLVVAVVLAMALSVTGRVAISAAAPDSPSGSSVAPKPGGRYGITCGEGTAAPGTGTRVYADTDGVEACHPQLRAYVTADGAALDSTVDDHQSVVATPSTVAVGDESAASATTDEVSLGPDGVTYTQRHEERYYYPCSSARSATVGSDGYSESYEGDANCDQGLSTFYALDTVRQVLAWFLPPIPELPIPEDPSGGLVSERDGGTCVTPHPAASACAGRDMGWTTVPFSAELLGYPIEVSHMPARDGYPARTYLRTPWGHTGTDGENWAEAYTYGQQGAGRSGAWANLPRSGDVGDYQHTTIARGSVCLSDCSWRGDFGADQYASEQSNSTRGYAGLSGGGNNSQLHVGSWHDDDWWNGTDRDRTETWGTVGGTSFWALHDYSRDSGQCAVYIFGPLNYWSPCPADTGPVPHPPFLGLP